MSDDTFDAAALLGRFDASRQLRTLPGLTVEVVGPLLVHHAAPLHCVVWADLQASSIQSAVGLLLSEHRRWGGSLEWKWFAHDPCAQQLPDVLLNNGFTAEADEAVMVCPIEQLPDMPQTNVKRVVGDGQMPDFTQTASTIFGKNYDYTTRQLWDVIRDNAEHHVAFVAYDAGQPAGVGRVYFNPGNEFAYMAGGGVLPAYRGRGHYRNLVLARAELARRKGIPYLMTDALPTSRPILERMGFRRITETRPYVLTAPLP